MEISSDHDSHKIKFSEFLKTIAVDIKKINDAYELIETLENKISQQFGVDGEDDDDDDEQFLKNSH